MALRAGIKLSITSEKDSQSANKKTRKLISFEFDWSIFVSIFESELSNYTPGEAGLGRQFMWYG